MIFYWQRKNKTPHFSIWDSRGMPDSDTVLNGLHEQEVVDIFNTTFKSQFGFSGALIFFIKKLDFESRPIPTKISPLLTCP